MTVNVNACLRKMSSKRSKTEKSDVKLSPTTRRLRAKVYKVWYHTGVWVRRPLVRSVGKTKKIARKRSSILAHLRSLNRFGWPSSCRTLYVRLTVIDKVRGSNNQAPRSYVNEDGISLVHQSHSTMLTLCRTLFMLTSLVTKLAEDKERGWLVLYQALSMMRSTT